MRKLRSEGEGEGKNGKRWKWGGEVRTKGVCDGGGIHGATAGEDEEVWEMKRKG